MNCFVSGCFDLLHSGHVAFLQQAATFGRLHVAIGSDSTVTALKGRPPVCSETERVFMLSALSCVHTAFVSSGSGELDFEAELRSVHPDVFVVNKDGHSIAKQSLCTKLGIEYQCLERLPYPGLTPRSTSALRDRTSVPYRIDLAGGWLDQPFVSTVAPGAVVTACIEPSMKFMERSGLATSTRKVAMKLWNRVLSHADYETAARILFAVENPPGRQTISGSQDAIGIVFPGFAKSQYSGNYWPDRISHRTDIEIVKFVNDHVRLVPLGPRRNEFDVLADTRISERCVKDLADAADRCWEALFDRDAKRFGAAVRASFEAQIEMFPYMINKSVSDGIRQFGRHALGWKVCGAGGGGYLLLVTEQDFANGVRISVHV